MLDHISFAVKNFEKSAAFYDATLGILGYKRMMEFNAPGHQGIGYGKNMPVFWIGSDASTGEQVGNASGFHIAFVGESSDAIDRWYAKCIELGAKDNGKPGLRKEYHPGYYGAFVVDPNGWRIEAVMHTYSGK